MDIKEGEVLGTYEGQVYARGRTVNDVRRELDDKYPDPDELRDLELLISLTDDEEYFEAHTSSKCWPMQLINSPENTQFSHNCIFDNRDVLAITDIPKGSEFLVNYGKGYWSETRLLVSPPRYQWKQGSEVKVFNNYIKHEDRPSGKGKKALKITARKRK